MGLVVVIKDISLDMAVIDEDYDYDDDVDRWKPPRKRVRDREPLTAKARVNL